MGGRHVVGRTGATRALNSAECSRDSFSCASPKAVLPNFSSRVCSFEPGVCLAASVRTPSRNEIKAPWMKEMKTQLATETGKEKYRKRKQTVEPVFGIVKHAMKFRQFLLRGIEKARGGWSLVALAYNCRRPHTLVRAGAG